MQVGRESPITITLIVMLYMFSRTNRDLFYIERWSSNTSEIYKTDLASFTDIFKQQNAREDDC